MSGSASAFDPSTWGDDEESTSAPDEIDELWDEIPDAERRAALYAELADLRELERSTQAQLDKALLTAEAAEAELARLSARIDATDAELAQIEIPDDAQGEG